MLLSALKTLVQLSETWKCTCVCQKHFKFSRTCFCYLLSLTPFSTSPNPCLSLIYRQTDMTLCTSLHYKVILSMNRWLWLLFVYHFVYQFVFYCILLSNNVSWCCYVYMETPKWYNRTFSYIYDLILNSIHYKNWRKKFVIIIKFDLKRFWTKKKSRQLKNFVVSVKKIIISWGAGRGGC